MSELEQSIMQALADNPRVHADEIAVEVLGGGAVMLRGTVGSLFQADEPARTVREVPGVLESRNGIVTLRGEVETEAQRDRAERIALAVPGVHGAHNELDVRSLTA